MTPDTHIVKTELFHDIPVRIVEVDGIPMIPVTDIVTALGYDRGNISRLMKRNKDLFTPYKGVVNITTPGGMQEMICLDDTGVVALLLKMDYSRIKEKGFRDKVLEFQQWSFTTLKKIMKGEIQTTLPIINGHPFTPLDHLNEQLDIADSIIKRSGMPKEIAHSMAIVLAGDKAGTDLHCYASYLKAQPTQLQLTGPETIQPLDQGEFDKHFSKQRLASHFGKTETFIHNTLEKLTIIVRSPSGAWHLTKHGEQFGKEFKVIIGWPYQNKKVTWVRYNPACIDLLKKYFDIQMPVAKVE
jgi:hypothetical protein